MVRGGEGGTFLGGRIISIKEISPNHRGLSWVAQKKGEWDRRIGLGLEQTSRSSACGKTVCGQRMARKGGGGL